MGNLYSSYGSSSSRAAPIPQGAPTDPSSSVPAPSISIPVGYEYEVFLSFRGPDTRTTFTDHLYHRLVSAGIRAFRDDEELRKGEEIGPELLAAMEQSKISIPILSRGYASSKWCLKEAVQMVGCMRRTGQMILPVFYHVKPHDVRHQAGAYDEAFRTHERTHPSEIVTQWRDALSEIGKLKGWDLTDPSNRYQGEVVKEIVSEVWKRLNDGRLDNPDHLIGIDDHVDEIMDMLAIETADVRIVGIWGIGGVGKTTVAKFIYNQLLDHFEHCCFLSDIREKSSQPNGMESLQSQLVSDILRHRPEEFANTDEGKCILRHRIPHEKVLILLDDVDSKEQLRNLLPGLRGYVSGSRIIVTVRNKAALEEFGVIYIYEVTEMNPEDALVLFCKHAFRQNFPIAEYAELSLEIVNATGGLPLAIEIIGSYLSSRLRVDVWHEATGQLKKEKTVHERLRISYDALGHNQQQIFLDIACFFAGMDHDVPLHLWKACEFSPAGAIHDLCMRSLIKIGNDKKVWMHDLLKDLGREIIRRENYTEPGERSRLWRHKDAIEVLEMDEGTSKVEAIHLDHGLDLEEEEKSFDGEKFAKLRKLRFLNLGDINLHGNHKGSLLRLKWLGWHGNTLLNIPSDLHPKGLVVLDLSNSSIMKEWIGWSSNKVLKKVEVVDLTNCHQLTRIPHFTSFQSIKKLILEDCRALDVVDESIRHLTTLKSLSLKNCSRLGRLPEELGSLSSLTELVVDRTAIQEIPISKGMPSLEILSAKGCRSLTQVPDLKEFSKLQQLLLNHCGSLEELPPSIGYWRSLEQLNLSHTSIRLLPDSVENLSKLKVLDISHSPLTNFPDSLWKLQNLEEVNASNCRSLAGTISSGVENPTLLRILRLDHTRITQVPSSIQGLGHLQTLNLRSCLFLETLPVLPSSLVVLKVTCQSLETAFLNLPNLVNLKQLEILRCPSITTIPESIRVLSRLKELFIGDCPELRSLPQLPKTLRCLQLSNLPSLGRLPDLSGLKCLSRFCLLRCPRIVEIPGLKQMVALKALKINSPLTNLDGLECPPSLSCLWIEGCKFKCISYLLEVNRVDVPIGFAASEILPKLKELRLGGCYRLQDFSTLTRLAALGILEISDCYQIMVLPDLSSLVQLKLLKLFDCVRLQDIRTLTRLESLEVLEISGFMETRIPELASLHKLRQLKLYGCQRLQGIPTLTDLALLEVLEISGCWEIRYLPHLSSLNGLQQLKLDDCRQLRELPALAGLASLEILEILNCGEIERLPDLSSLQKLRQLNLLRIELPRVIPGLTRLTSLEVVGISYCNNIENLPDLLSLTELKQLKLDNLPLERTPALTGLTSLEMLHISEFGERHGDLSSLCKLEELTLASTRDIPQLTRLDSLVELVFRGQFWATLPDLSHLKELKQLKLSRCHILQPVSRRTRLESLEILQICECFGVRMLHDQSSFCNLEKLYIDRCYNMGPVDLSGLKKLRELRLLHLRHSVDILGLLQLASLEVLHIIYHGQPAELPVLSQQRNLRELRLDNVRGIVRNELLEEWVYLEVLELSRCPAIEDPLHLSKLQMLRELTLHDCRQIQGLEELVSLEVLKLYRCGVISEILDLSKVQMLRQLSLNICRHLVRIQGFGELECLEVVDLSSCHWLREISDLSKLHELRELRLTNCRSLLGIQGLRELISLRALDLSYCSAIRKISDLSKLHELRELKLIGCRRLKGIQGLGELECLEILYLSDCDAIREISDLSKLQNLRKLKLTGCRCLEGIQGLGEVGCLEVLYLSNYDAITEVPDLSKLTKLRELRLTNCVRLEGISRLAKLTSLEALDLSKCEAITEIPDLSKLKILRQLKLTGCRRLKGIQRLRDCEPLHILDLSKCEAITEIPDLSKLWKLRELRLTSCRHLPKIQGLGVLISLRALDLSMCGAITEILDLSDLRSLEELKLTGCRCLEGIPGLGGLTSLRDLDLSKCEAINAIPDLSNLHELRTLKLSRCHQQLLQGIPPHIHPEFV